MIAFARHMTLREYFMAHAPAEPQPWFQPTMPPKPEPDFLDVAPRVQNAIDVIEWENERAKQRYIQWPAAWADEILKGSEA